MIRPFHAHDIQNFPNVKILTHTKKNGVEKDYLLIERKPFISCFVTINNQYGVFIEQYRPIIDKTTLEIPMGKIESQDASPKEAMIRELQEECNIFLIKSPHIVVQDSKTCSNITIPFDSFKIQEQKPNYLSPGFSTSLQYPFTLELYTSDENLQTLLEHSLISQECDLKVHCYPLNSNLLDQLDGISRYNLINFLYDQLNKKHQ